MVEKDCHITGSVVRSVIIYSSQSYMDGVYNNVLPAILKSPEIDERFCDGVKPRSRGQLLSFE